MAARPEKAEAYNPWQHALKGQKPIAQGSALGIIAIGKAPCKGKSFMFCLKFKSFCPYRAIGLRS